MLSIEVSCDLLSLLNPYELYIEYEFHTFTWLLTKYAAHN